MAFNIRMGWPEMEALWSDLHLAAVETDLAFRLAPAMRRPVCHAHGEDRTPFAHGLHHLAKRLKPSRQAKPLEARRDARQRFDLQLSRGKSQWM